MKYGEGDWVGVPLPDGGFGVGLVARVSAAGILLGYFFGPRLPAVPTLTDVAGLVPRNAVLVGRFGHLGIKRGGWPIIGSLDRWDREAWPMPALVRYEELTDRSFLVHYDPDDPATRAREEPAPPGVAEQAPKDGMMGAGYVEELLDLLLGGPPPR